MKKILSGELAEILKGNIDFVLELSVLQEPKFCVKPVYKFMEAFVCDINIPEFCLIYCEADDPEEIHASLNSTKFEKFLRGCKTNKTIYHGENGKGELCESYYHDCRDDRSPRAANCRLLTPDDKYLRGLYNEEDDYFNIIYNDFIENKIYHDCGIIAAFDENNMFTGYLAYYEIAENIRDVSYIYVEKKFRGRGYGKSLLNYFVNKNITENKISYYSYADGEISENLAKSCGFLPCAKRYEYETGV